MFACYRNLPLSEGRLNTRMFGGIQPKSAEENGPDEKRNKWDTC